MNFFAEPEQSDEFQVAQSQVRQQLRSPQAIERPGRRDPSFAGSHRVCAGRHDPLSQRELPEDDGIRACRDRRASPQHVRRSRLPGFSRSTRDSGSSSVGASSMRAQYLRIGKDGRRVWIQATYNPVLDAEGNAIKVVKFATDISAQKAAGGRVPGVSMTPSIGSRASSNSDLDGSIITANANFLKAVGYGLDRYPRSSPQHVRGVHLPGFARIQALLGKTRGRAVRRRSLPAHRQGLARQVWLQASYNPIFNAEGKPYKVMKFATDITPEITASHMNAVYRGALDNVTANVMVADMDLNIIYVNKSASTLMTAWRGPTCARTCPHSMPRSWSAPTSMCSTAIRRTSASCSPGSAAPSRASSRSAVAPCASRPIR